MVSFARFKEVFGDVRSTYASKAMQWFGDRLIVNAKDKGMPFNFWWDQEDRHVLKGDEASDLRYQRLQTRTDDFRRYLNYGVGRFMPYVIPVLALPLLMVCIVTVKAFGPPSLNTDKKPGVEAPATNSNEAQRREL